MKPTNLAPISRAPLPLVFHRSVAEEKKDISFHGLQFQMKAYRKKTYIETACMLDSRWESFQGFKPPLIGNRHPDPDMTQCDHFSGSRRACKSSMKHQFNGSVHGCPPPLWLLRYHRARAVVYYAFHGWLAMAWLTQGGKTIGSVQADSYWKLPPWASKVRFA